MTTLEYESKEIQLAITNGWKDIHGGGSEGGAYWRGINPSNKRVEKLPAEYTPLNFKEAMHKLWAEYHGEIDIGGGEMWIPKAPVVYERGFEDGYKLAMSEHNPSNNLMRC